MAHTAAARYGTLHLDANPFQLCPPHPPAAQRQLCKQRSAFRSLQNSPRARAAAAATTTA